MSYVKAGLVLSDFNSDNLAAYLRNDKNGIQANCESAPFGQITQYLLDADNAVWRPFLDFAVVWSRPEAVLESFGRALAGLAVDRAELMAEVDEYCRRVLLAEGRARVLFVPTWVVPGSHSGHGMLALAADGGVTRFLLEANLRLMQNFDGHPGVITLNAAKWIEVAGVRAFNARLWYSSKTPFGNEVFKAAAEDIKAALHGLEGRARKLVIVDLDDTLWGGIVGDVGWENLVLGGHDPAGEALVDFQRELEALTRRGVVLGIVSKNEEDVAMEAISHHPHMVLRKESFAGWRINWLDKAQNIADLCTTLNLGTESAVFIDDNPFERARVREALPGVFVPEWPEDKRLYPQALRGLTCFDKPAVSTEDRRRAEMYARERQRLESRSEVGSIEQWLQTLNLVVHVEPMNAANLRRVAQLLNKTNQMNLSTRRMTEPELQEWAANERRQVLAFHLSDRFGDFGLVGVVSAQASGEGVDIIDFVLSCRAMGRKLEETMLSVAIEWAQAMEAPRVRAVYKETARNAPCRKFFEASGLRREGADVFIWDLQFSYPAPQVVSLIRDSWQVAYA
jgi:FkbH-like protein